MNKDTDGQRFAVLDTPWYKFSDEIDPDKIWGRCFKIWGRCFVYIQGWREHSGAIWHRTIVGECTWSGEWRQSDVDRLLADGDMDGGRVTHFAPFRGPGVTAEMDERGMAA